LEKRSVTCEEIVEYLESLANPHNVAGMARYGIRPRHALGISIPTLRALARKNGSDHRVAGQLWRTGIHEARILAAYIDDPAAVTEAQMERWVKDFESWDVCDQVVSNLFDRTAWAHAKAVEWSARPEEFVKRAGFTMMAALAVHDKGAEDAAFLRFLPIIEREAADDRNFVKKAVNWALRQIGKRNRVLHARAVTVASRLCGHESKAARWIGRDAVREFASEKTQARLG
jgi:3-methyladenine DNA glycosylase AlkD